MLINFRMGQNEIGFKWIEMMLQSEFAIWRRIAEYLEP